MVNKKLPTEKNHLSDSSIKFRNKCVHTFVTKGAKNDVPTMIKNKMIMPASTTVPLQTEINVNNVFPTQCLLQHLPLFIYCAKRANILGI